MNAIAVDPLIAEAKHRAWRRRLLVAALLLLLAGGSTLGVELTSAGGGTSGPVPWVATKPNIGPAHPPLAPPCTASQLRAAMSFSGGAGVLFGRMDIVNRSSTACSLVGRPQLSFGGMKTEEWGPNSGPSPSVPFDPLAPPIGSLRALAPGGHVAAGLFWGPCPDGGGMSGAPERTATLTAPGGGAIRVVPAGNLGCHNYGGSVPAVDRFTPVIPDLPRSSILPLRASIITGPPPKGMDGRILFMHPGRWLSYTVALTNWSRHTYRFGRTCPAYTEELGSPSAGDPRAWDQAYVLNCHAVGPIAPHASVRFAMRVHIPASATDVTAPTLLWQLAPHTYDAPGAFVELFTR